VMFLPLLRIIEPTAPFSTRVFGKLPEVNKAGAKSIFPSVLAASIMPRVKSLLLVAPRLVRPVVW